MALLALSLLGGTASFAQEMEKKSDKKEIKATKKMAKGKHHKAMKKEVKSEKKETMGK